MRTFFLVPRTERRGYHAYDYDSFGRVLSLTLPDGEVLTHRYDAGGNLARISSEKQGAQTVYLEKLEYDAFEQRTEMGERAGVRSCNQATSRLDCGHGKTIED